MCDFNRIIWIKPNRLEWFVGTCVCVICRFCWWSFNRSLFFYSIFDYIFFLSHTPPPFFQYSRLFCERKNNLSRFRNVVAPCTKTWHWIHYSFWIQLILEILKFRAMHLSIFDKCNCKKNHEFHPTNHSPVQRLPLSTTMTKTALASIFWFSLYCVLHAANFIYITSNLKQ